MKNTIQKYGKLFALAVMLPFIYGCGAGAGTGSLLGFLFGGGSGITDLALINGGSGGGALISGASLAAFHNPEPASMLLVGGGLAAMTYFKSKANRENR